MEEIPTALPTQPIFRRIAVLDHALKDLPRQAYRLARLMARRAKSLSGSGRAGLLRRGHPPGHRRRSRHEVDAVLRECHMLVRDRLAGDGGYKPP